MGPVNSTGVYLTGKVHLESLSFNSGREGRVGWVKACVSNLIQATFELLYFQNLLCLIYCFTALLIMAYQV